MHQSIGAQRLMPRMMPKSTDLPFSLKYRPSRVKIGCWADRLQRFQNPPVSCTATKIKKVLIEARSSSLRVPRPSILPALVPDGLKQGVCWSVIQGRAFVPHFGALNDRKFDLVSGLGKRAGAFFV